MPDILALLDPTQMPPLVLGAVFAAALLQAVTGIGFGVIAGPVLLVVMRGPAAIQVSIVLSFVIALLTAPQTLARVDRRLLRQLLGGLCLGTPLGALAAVTLTLGGLKLVAAVVVAAMTVIATGVLARYPVIGRDTPARRWGTGVIAGALNTALAMPGPAIAAYATAIRSGKDAVRATTLAAFLAAYPIALAAQALVLGLSAELPATALALLAPTVLGTLAGCAAVHVVNETLFRWTTTLFLMASAVGLIVL